MAKALVRVFTIAFATSFLVGVTPAVAAQSGDAGDIPEVRAVRTTWTSEFDTDRPAGVAYVPPRHELLVADPAATNTAVVRLDRDETQQGELQLPALSDPSTLAFDAAGNQLTAVSNDEVVVVPGAAITNPNPTVQTTDVENLALDDSRGATYDAQGTWYVLDANGPEIVSVAKRSTTPGPPVHTSLASQLGGRTLRGLAFNPSDGLLYVMSPDEGLVYGLNPNGTIVKQYDISSLDLRNPSAMTFAPSTDSTDVAATQNLFISDSGDQSQLGGVTEVTLTQAAALAAPVDSATLVRTIDTSAFSPASPDPSGVTYLPGSGRLEICDSEVEEVTGAGYHGVNLWQITRTGTVTDTGTTFPAYSKEPNGLGFMPAGNTLLMSDDSARRVHLVRPGGDGRYGTSDDNVNSFIATAQYGSMDTEDPTFDPVSGDIFWVDGVNTEVYRVHAVNGIFGDSDDVMTHFDVGQYGITDTEALEYYAPNDTLIVGDRPGKRLLELTKAGALLRIIDLTGISGLSLVSGLTVAPSSTGNGQLNYWIVDRKQDNGANPNENDGKLYEVSAGATQNTQPVMDSASIDQTAPKTNDTLTVTASGHDADGDTLTYRYQWRKNGVLLTNETGPTLNLATAGNGDKGDLISVRVSVFDGTIESDPLTTTQVAVVNSPPVFNQNLGNRGDAEGAAVSLSAVATDPDNDGLTYGATGLPGGVSINTSTGAISGTIANGASNGSPYSTSISVTDGTAGAPNDTFTWTVSLGSAPPVITPGSVATAEGNSGSHTVNVPVTLDHASASTVTVQYQTTEPGITNGAKAPGDYTAASGTVTFQPNDTSESVPVTVNGDRTREGDEVIVVKFSNPTNATVGGYLGLGFVTITNDDPLPVITPGSVTTAEGNSGSHNGSFTVTLDRPSSSTVTVQYQTIEPAISNGAKAPGDYTAKSGTVTFQPGVTSQTVSVSIKGETAVEGDEVVTVQFTNPANATVGGYLGLGFVIIDNDD